jgi:ATP-dependent Clp protease adaptor protein ClpS
MATSSGIPHIAPFEFDEQEVLSLTEKGYQLVVWNDDVNTFEWVIKALIEICGHSQEQAEQCSILIHTQGKYAVKNGDLETLKPMCEAILDRGISATLERVDS